jgi:hypothetical protein
MEHYSDMNISVGIKHRTVGGPAEDGWIQAQKHQRRNASGLGRAMVAAHRRGAAAEVGSPRWGRRGSPGVTLDGADGERRQVQRERGAEKALETWGGARDGGTQGEAEGGGSAPRPTGRR